jgi:hypothetical protein
MQSKLPNRKTLKTCHEEDQPFNPRILTAMSGAANVGIDNPKVFGACHLEFPTSSLDVKQEKDRTAFYSTNV